MEHLPRCAAWAGPTQADSTGSVDGIVARDEGGSTRPDPPPRRSRLPPGAVGRHAHALPGLVQLSPLSLTAHSCVLARHACRL